MTMSYHSNSPVIEAICLGNHYHTRQLQEIYDVSGHIVAKAAIMPVVYIQDKILALRESPLLPLEVRYKLLKQAGKIYAEATLAGLDPQAYISLASRVSGLQPSIISDSIANIAYSLHHMQENLAVATPAGAVWDICDPKVNAGCSFFSRRGDIVAIIAAGNGPGVHGLWPQAIAMGYKTLVRPSLREPFTAQRLVCALEQAGLGNHVAFIPTDHKGAEALISQSDLAVVYGGQDVAAKYGNNPHILVQGPGHSKIVVGSDVRQEEAVALAAQSILSLGGAACVSASAILVEHNSKQFAEKLRCELRARMHHQPPRLSRQQEADAYRMQLERDNVPWMYSQLPDHSCLLNPHIEFVESFSDSKVQREVPFPCATVASFSREEACYKALSGSLVVTVLTRDCDIINKIIADTSIANVYVGEIPTTWMDFRVPHSGYLADFLMCNRGIRLQEGWL